MPSEGEFVAAKPTAARRKNFIEASWFRPLDFSRIVRKISYPFWLTLLVIPGHPEKVFVVTG
jgi:hypothetical protein